MPLGLPQVAVFVWCGVRGNFLTIDNLIRRQKILVSWCSRCERNAETENHPRIHCLATWEVWTSVLSWFRVVWIFGWSFTTSSFLEREQKEENLGNDSSLFDVDCSAREEFGSLINSWESRECSPSLNQILNLYEAPLS